MFKDWTGGRLFLCTSVLLCWTVACETDVTNTTVPDLGVTLIEPAAGDVDTNSVFLRWTPTVLLDFAAYLVMHVDGPPTDGGAEGGILKRIEDLSVTEHEVAGLKSGWDFRFRVDVLTTAGKIYASNEVSVVTMAPPGPVLHIPKSDEIGDDWVLLQWDWSVSKPAEFRAYWVVQANSPPRILNSIEDPLTTNFGATNLPPGRVLSFRVDVLDSLETRRRSNVVHATTHQGPSTPDAVMANLRDAFESKDTVKYELALSNQFQFEFHHQEVQDFGLENAFWSVDEELASIGAAFGKQSGAEFSDCTRQPPVEAIQVTTLAPQEPVWRAVEGFALDTLARKYRLSLTATLNGGETLTSDGVGEFFVELIDLDIGEGLVRRVHKLRLWKDLGDDTRSSAESASRVNAHVGRFKMLYDREFSMSEWRILADGPDAVSLKAAWVFDEADMFAVGTQGTILRYQNGAWTSMTSGVSGLLTGVWGTSNSDVFAVGSAWILHFNGNTWSSQRHTNPQYWVPTFVGVWGTSWQDVYTVGLTSNDLPEIGTISTGEMKHYDGTEWTRVSLPLTGLCPDPEELPSFDCTPYLRSIWGPSPSDVFAVGGSELGGAILHWNGSAWNPMAVPPGTPYLNDVWGVSSNDVFAVGTGMVLHFNGSTWQTIDSTPPSIGSNGIWGRSGNDVFVIGATVHRYDGSDWFCMTKPTSESLLDMGLGTSGEALVVGSRGTIASFAPLQ